MATEIQPAAAAAADFNKTDDDITGEDGGRILLRVS